jgi:HK97 family phage major capsid protein
LQKDRIAKVDYDTFVGKINTRFDEIDKELAKLKAPVISDAGKSPDLHVKAFDRYLRNQALSPDEVKVLTIADTTHAGVLAPYEYVNAIIKAITLQHPMRDLATIRQTSAYAVELPTETAVPAATWVAESSEKTETTGLTYALTEIKTFEAKMLFKATQKLLEDSAFNIETELATVYARKFGALEGTAFYSGGGSTAPEGITVNTTVLADAKNVATDNTLAFDDIIGTQYTLASAYARNAAWLMNRSLVGVLVGMKNATTNSYILQPDNQEGYPMRLLGSPIYEWSDFPAISSTTLSSVPGDGGIVLAYGDFRAGYNIVDRIELTVQRLVEKYAEYGMIGFLARRRVGGGVVLPEAIQLLKNITS